MRRTFLICLFCVLLGATGSVSALALGGVNQSSPTPVAIDLARAAGGHTGVRSCGVAGVASKPRRGSMLFGNRRVESAVDASRTGWAQAFPFRSAVNGTVESVALYLDRHNRAKRIAIGVYAGSACRPGSMVTKGVLASPRAGAWNEARVRAAAVRSGRIYWLVVLGRGGTLAVRDRGAAHCNGMVSHQRRMTTLASRWRAGTRRGTCALSAYAKGRVASLLYGTLGTVGPPGSQTGSGGGGTLPWSCPGVRCFYIASNGSDSNTGTSESSPWAHAPGMPTFNCTGACSYTHDPGDAFIFRGGDTWGNASFPLATRSGNASHSDYYGVDPNWYSGASWSQPVFDAQNQPVTGADANGPNGDHSAGQNDTVIDLSSQDYVTVDDIAFTSFCAQNTANECSPTSGAGHTYSPFNCATIMLDGNGSTNADQHIVLNRLYIHNFYIDEALGFRPVGVCNVIESASQGPGYDGNSVLENSTIDGGNGAAYGAAIWDGPTNLLNNSIHDVGDIAVLSGHGTIAGNQLYDCAYPNLPSDGGTYNGDLHSNAIETIATDGAFYIHDNVIHDTVNSTDECEAMLLGNTGETDYVWNNVLYNIHGNGMGLVQGSTAGTAAYFWNNTTEGGLNFTRSCLAQGHSGTTGTVVYENNLCITNASTAINPDVHAGTLTVDHNVLMSPSTATADGYTTSQKYPYSPTSTQSPTTGTGTNLTTDCTPTITLCTDTTYGATRTTLPRPPQQPWDAGAYQLP